MWCQFNEEADLLESIIPGAKQVSGSQKDEVKESRFMDFINGDIRVLVTKPKIGALGLNFQHCAHLVYFPSHSFEQYYQAVRRCWRFGQKRPVTVDIVMTEGERKVMENLRRKADAAEVMFGNLISEMNNAMAVSSDRSSIGRIVLPKWLEDAA